MLSNALKYIQDSFDHLLSYFTAFLALIMSLPMMKIGGAILLISRLIVDVPPAYKKLREFFKNDPQHR